MPAVFIRAIAVNLEDIQNLYQIKFQYMNFTESSLKELSEARTKNLFFFNF